MGSAIPGLSFAPMAGSLTMRRIGSAALFLDPDTPLKVSSRLVVTYLDLVAVRQPAQAEGGAVETGFSQKAVALSPAQGECDFFEVQFGQDAVFDDAGHPSVCRENQQVHGFLPFPLFFVRPGPVLGGQ